MRRKGIQFSHVASGMAITLAGVLAVPQLAQAQSQEQTADDTNGGLTEIIVTAQRREENQQDVPISITAIDASTLSRAGVGGTLQINEIVPSVQVTRQGPSTIFYVRGIGSSTGGVGEDGANAFYVDGVYLGDLVQVNTEFNNIERIEVLKGPQGTLFGRNSSGGLVNIITREPDDATVVKGMVGYANYDMYKGQAYLAAPLSSSLSVDLAVTGRDQNDGWGKNLANGKDFALGWMYGARSKLVWRPSEQTKVVLAGDFTKSRDNFTNGYALFKGSVALDGSTYQGDYNVNTDVSPYAAVKSGGGSLTLEHELDWATITSVSALRGYQVKSVLDSDGSRAPLLNVDLLHRGESFQQELRLSSTATTPLSWQIGAFYYKAKVRVIDQTVTGSALGGVGRGFRLATEMRTESIAPFGEATLAVSDSTHITAGVRFTHEKRRYAGTQAPVNQPAGSPFFNAFSISEKRDAITFNKLTYRFAVRQDLSEDVNVYASYNRGFKSGIFALNATPGVNPPIRPQTIDAFEVGLKSELFDNRLRFNIAAFHYVVENFQTRSSAPGGGGTVLLLNAAKVKVDGVEGEVEYAPTGGLRLFANATYLNSRFVSFPNNASYVPNPATCVLGANPPGFTTGPRTGGNRLCFGPATGNRTPQSPRFSGTVGASYEGDVGQDGKLFATVLFNHRSKIFIETDNRLSQGSISLLNASLEYRPSPNWGIEVYGNNLLDVQHYVVGVSTGVSDQGALGAPRTYGINLKFNL